ncbi:DUF6428 family protein [Mesohalobacter halotolerans]|uniref:Uncharacterized protein n=1 Tax=Mesohalobacter halotolerans TaxID=1883405 RepID=A0A4U5TU05_9FLAO|nr:DUF6428 family protein [Mesohalobacter halotolerans]MBS3738741.1 hypothetical protein [Psychroflexus sp.]TKS56768.1 hypothetical protein FCN74_07005 [Mesohalobacter halotolerans]
MTLAEIKNNLKKIETLKFILPDGTQVPSHFHVTEVGKVTKHFIDCGGTERFQNVINFQLWTADDVDHRLQAEKLNSIISLSEKKLNLDENAQIEVEYQGQTIETYGLDFEDEEFKLIPQQTDCLAKDKCGIPESKPKVKLSDMQASQACCSPDSGCC